MEMKELEKFYLALGQVVDEILCGFEEVTVRAIDRYDDDPEGTMEAVRAFHYAHRPPETPISPTAPPWLLGTESPALSAIRPPDRTPSTEWVTTSEAAEQLRFKTSQGVRDAIKRGELRAVRRGRRILIHADDIEEFIRGKPVTHGPSTRRNKVEDLNGDTVEQIEEEQVPRNPTTPRRAIRRPSPGPGRKRENTPATENSLCRDDPGGSGGGAGPDDGGTPTGDRGGRGPGGADPFGLRKALAEEEKT